ncbi:MAG: SH3 domain-containing protein [Pseudomonadota bacterium]
MRFCSLKAFAAALFCVATLTPVPAAADHPIRTDTPSGYPVPRFVSLKGDKTYCRAGPSKAHPIRFTFQKAGAPVMVIAETVDHWRRIKDREGDVCWAHKTVLKAQSHAFSTREINILSRPHMDAKVRGRIAGAVLVRTEKEKGGWVRISVGSLRGWVPGDALWGHDAPRALAAAHN